MATRNRFMLRMGIAVHGIAPCMGLYRKRYVLRFMNDAYNVGLTRDEVLVLLSSFDCDSRDLNMSFPQMAGMAKRLRY